MGASKLLSLVRQRLPSSHPHPLDRLAPQQHASETDYENANCTSSLGEKSHRFSFSSFPGVIKRRRITMDAGMQTDPIALTPRSRFAGRVEFSSWPWPAKYMSQVERSPSVFTSPLQLVLDICSDGNRLQLLAAFSAFLCTVNRLGGLLTCFRHTYRHTYRLFFSLSAMVNI